MSCIGRTKSGRRNLNFLGSDRSNFAIWQYKNCSKLEKVTFNYVYCCLLVCLHLKKISYILSSLSKAFLDGSGATTQVDLELH